MVDKERELVLKGRLDLSTFKSREERERILYKNFVQVGQDVKEMIATC